MRAVLQNRQIRSSKVLSSNEHHPSFSLWVNDPTRSKVTITAPVKANALQTSSPNLKLW